MTISKQAVKRVLPQSLRTKYEEARAQLKAAYMRRLSTSERLSTLHYALRSKAFRREHKGVTYGKRIYNEQLAGQKANRYLLRRNTHRLEKGLLMRPRRDVFASKFILETAEAYRGIIRAGADPLGDPELKWSYDVLDEYFTVVPPQAEDSEVERARRIFSVLVQNNFVREMIPYKRRVSDTPPVSYDDFLALSQHRRSVRWYLPTPVPRDLIDQAVTAAALSPSACNRQPFEFRVFDEPELVNQVSSIPMGTRGFSHNFPAVVVVVGKLRAYFDERDRHVIYIDGSLASMSFMYALETLGLSSCPINWPDQEPHESKMQKLLNLEPDERVIMLISVGYPDPEGLVAYSQKKPLETIRRYNAL